MLARIEYPRRDRRAVLRGLVAVAALFLSGLDALVSAATGFPPVAWCVRQVATLVRDAYRLGHIGVPSESAEVERVVVEGEIVDE
jgi:hypothetical protein